ncbi:molybdopterin converting factor subunit 1 [Accumulibacter sp.]|uniref:molybdopterin converting factor subunit 1 n=1 Tax=Accumulibacter sp. TaxID=2053492 RepID=UPI0025D46B3D|nr:molybdopterin converting factor subunit 1 [Accumulibacter sp.]MCM8596431.1 molybdopterin converting factor subunit 1 [Accumulibacter sp.]MCM8626303.1 molybdopterin converting factor subunit 1 [Accumulibacter sp.]MDS4050580.1 molybdopterin converting factor subunit 1 [Accumulibacter sp.]
MPKILYFASLREALGRASEQIELPPGVGDVTGLIAFLAARGGPWEQLATLGNLRCAVNQEMAKPDSPVTGGDEVAFFPPVSGG